MMTSKTLATIVTSRITVLKQDKFPFFLHVNLIQYLRAIVLGLKEDLLQLHPSHYSLNCFWATFLILSGGNVVTSDRSMILYARTGSKY